MLLNHNKENCPSRNTDENKSSKAHYFIAEAQTLEEL